MTCLIYHLLAAHANTTKRFKRFKKPETNKTRCTCYANALNLSSFNLQLRENLRTRAKLHFPGSIAHPS